MISTGELRKGVVIELDDNLFQVVDWEHIKIGRGSAQVRLKLRDLRGGHTRERTFQASSKFRRVRLERRTMQYLYADGQLHYFMHQDTYEQIPLTTELLEDALPYLVENGAADVLFVGEEPIGVELPAAVNLRVTQTEPGLRGDTQSAATKAATLETGLLLTLPLFVQEGDVVKVDTRTGAYLERVQATS